MGGDIHGSEVSQTVPPHFAKTKFLYRFDPRPRLGGWLCLATTGVRNKDSCKINKTRIGVRNVIL